jgi:hypothetical protein
VKKMRFSLKTSKLMYGPEPERTVQSVIGKFIFTNCPIAYVSYSRVVLLEIELTIGPFSVFKVMEPQGNYMEELYD